MVGAAGWCLMEALGGLEEAAVWWVWGRFWEAGGSFAGHREFQMLSWRTVELQGASEVHDHGAHLREK